MRIAVCGTHSVGKTTLVADLRRGLTGYDLVPEPYNELLDRGHAFADEPSVEDFLEQLEHSVARLTSDHAARVLYDRCPADFLAYLAALGAHDLIGDWLAPAQDALRTLDLVVFVPIERPDRIAGTGDTDRLRRKVDMLLHRILLDDEYGLGASVISVSGSEAHRVGQVTAAVQERGPIT